MEAICSSETLIPTCQTTAPCHDIVHSILKHSCRETHKLRPHNLPGPLNHVDMEDLLFFRLRIALVRLMMENWVVPFSESSTLELYLSVKIVCLILVCQYGCYCFEVYPEDGSSTCYAGKLLPDYMAWHPGRLLLYVMVANSGRKKTFCSKWAANWYHILTFLTG